MPVNNFYVSTENQLHAIMLELRTIRFEIQKLKEGQNKIFAFSKLIYDTPRLRRKLRHRLHQAGSIFPDVQTGRSHRGSCAELFPNTQGFESAPAQDQKYTEWEKPPRIELQRWKAAGSEPEKVRLPYTTADYGNLKDEGSKTGASHLPTQIFPTTNGDDIHDGSFKSNSIYSAADARVPFAYHSNKQTRSFPDCLAAAQPTIKNLLKRAQTSLSKLTSTCESSSDEVSNDKLHASGFLKFYDQPEDFFDSSVQEELEKGVSFQQHIRTSKKEKYHRKFCPYYNLRDLSGWRRHRQHLYFIFHDEYFSKTAFRVLLFTTFLIVISTLFYIMETVPSIASYTEIWSTAELVVTILFTIEYLLRLISVKNKLAYIFKPINVVDLLAVLPYFIEKLYPGLPTTSLRVVRIIRLARLARLRNLFSEYIEIMICSISGAAEEAGPMMGLLIIVEVILFGCSVYAVEKDNNANGSFESIPDSMWWVVVTMTTVGYGDMSPTTDVGRMLGVLCMLSGVILMSICITIIGGNFEQAHHALLIEKEKHMKRNENIQGNESIWRADTMKIITRTESAPPTIGVLNSFQLDTNRSHKV